MPKITDPGELELIKKIHGFGGKYDDPEREPNEKVIKIKISKNSGA